MNNVLYVIFRAADNGVHDIYFSHADCAAAYYELLRRDPANGRKYYYNAVNMDFMRAPNCTKHASNCTKHASNCTKTARN